MTDVAGSTPEQYALRVRTHPGVLQISASNKIRRAEEVRISWSGRLIESYELSKRPEIIEKNLNNSVAFINSLGNNFERNSNYYLWRNINIDNVKQFLTGFELYDNLKSAAPQNLLKFIDFKYRNSELQFWNIGLITKQQGVSFLVNEHVNINLIKRTQADESTESLYYIKKSHIISPDDEFIDLTENEKELARQASVRIWREKKGVTNGEPLRLYGDWVRNKITKPEKVLLLLYFLNPEGACIRDLSKPIVGYAISFPGTDNDDAVTYAVNRQLLQNFDLEDVYESEEEDDDED
jgi:hypothetical protein